jgi:hypothetical protein
MHVRPWPILAIGALVSAIALGVGCQRDAERQSVATDAANPHAAAPQSHARYAAKVPASIITPDVVETKFGTLRFDDGRPDAATVKLVMDRLDFSRGVDAFLVGMPAASVHALCNGLQDAGAEANHGITITENLADARTLLLTPNSTTVYVSMCADLAQGPVVLDVPPGVLGTIDDAYFRFVADVGMTGADGGRGGTYLLVPPDYKGALPKSGHVLVHSRTFTNFVFYRAFVRDGDIAAAVRDVKAKARIHPYAPAGSPAATAFVNLSGKQVNTIHANDYHFYEELDAVVQHEPASALDPETAGLFSAIGLRKGQPFAPDARMKALLVDAVAVGNATARALSFAPRDPRAMLYPDRQWNLSFIGGNHEFADAHGRILDARVMFHYMATGITPAMAAAKPGSGSAYAFAARDAKGAYFDGAKTYKVTLPAPIPAGQFWSFTAYDNQTRSLLETDQKLAGVDSNQPGLTKNADGSVTVWFAPKPPAGHEGNWVQTIPGKGWSTLLRLYAPLQPWFDKTWKPGDIEPVE